MAISPKLIISPQGTFQNRGMPRVQSAKSIVTTRTSNNSGFLKTTKFKDLLNFKSIPEKIQQDKESLYEDNLALKITVNKLSDNLTRLKTKLQSIKNTNKKIEKGDNQESLLIHLKKIIKDLNKKLADRDEENKELKRNFKITRFNELELELKAYQEECNRLRFHLKSLIDKNNVNAAVLDLEKDLYEKQGVVNELKKECKEYQKEITKLKEENAIIRDTHSRNSLKRNHLRTFDSVTNCTKCQDLQINLDQATIECDQLSLNLKQTTDQSHIKTQQLEDKIKSSEKLTEELQATIKNLTKQLSEARSSSINFTFIDQNLAKPPAQDPPLSKLRPSKFFKRIHQIIKEKFMFLSVFLSFLDRDNTGFTYQEDLKKGTAYNGKYLKDSDISYALNIMGCTTRQIPIKLIEQWYEKFSFDELGYDEDQSIKRKQKVEAVSRSTQFEPMSIKNTQSGKVEFKDISFVFEQIKMIMLEREIPRHKTILHIFKEDYSMELVVKNFELKNMFIHSILEINSDSTMAKFCEFLVEGGELGSNTFREILKKFNRHLPDWKIIDRFWAHMEMRSIFKQNSQDIIEMCHKSRDNVNQLISLQELSEIIKKFGFFAEDALVHLYIISFEKTRKVGKIDFLKVFEGFDEKEEFLKGMKRKYADIIKAIRMKMWNTLDTLDNFMGLSPEFGIPVNQFISSMQSLGIK